MIQFTPEQKKLGIGEDGKFDPHKFLRALPEPLYREVRGEIDRTFLNNRSNRYIPGDIEECSDSGILAAAAEYGRDSKRLLRPWQPRERIVNVDYFDGYCIHNVYNSRGERKPAKGLFKRPLSYDAIADKKESEFWDGRGETEGAEQDWPQIQKKLPREDDSIDAYCEQPADNDISWPTPVVADWFDFSDPTQMWPLFDLFD